MKRSVFCGIAASIFMASAMALSSCSEVEPETGDGTGDPSEQQGGKPNNPFEGIFDVPADLAEKIHAIYDHAELGPQTIRTVSQLAIATSVCASIECDGPITVTPGKLNGKPVTLVTLGGTEQKEGQATTMTESQKSSFGQPNDYLTAVLGLFRNGTVPAGKPVVVTGISLGGMIAQQLLGQEEVMSSHEIMAVVTFGSPANLPLDRKGVKVVRFADVNDKVPSMGEMLLRSGMVLDKGLNKDEQAARLEELDAAEKISRSSKYSGMIETHALSYVEDPCWNDVDFLGDPDKGNVLVLEKGLTFYPAPKL